jgi:hypothetical protein
VVEGSGSLSGSGGGADGVGYGVDHAREGVHVEIFAVVCDDGGDVWVGVVGRARSNSAPATTRSV